MTWSVLEKRIVFIPIWSVLLLMFCCVAAAAGAGCNSAMADGSGYSSVALI